MSLFSFAVRDGDANYLGRLYVAEDSAQIATVTASEWVKARGYEASDMCQIPSVEAPVQTGYVVFSPSGNIKTLAT